MEFDWDDDRNGVKIDTWIDDMCCEFPGIMLDVLKIGINDLQWWFGSDDVGTQTWKVATCGCLVGTSAIAARNQVQCAIPVVDLEANRLGWVDRDGPPATLVLYLACVVASKRDISQYVLPNKADFDLILTANFYTGKSLSGTKSFDPLLVRIGQVGTIAGHEAYSDKRNAIIVEYMEERILTNLALLGQVKVGRYDTKSDVIGRLRREQ